MPYEYIIEMICDWWAFSWAKENLFEIFKWYDEHKDYMKLSDWTRIEVEDILKQMKAKLEREKVFLQRFVGRIVAGSRQRRKEFCTYMICGIAEIPVNYVQKIL